MGGCFSSPSSANESEFSSTAMVILLNGDLNECHLPASVSQVLRAIPASSAYLCNSDMLSYDDYVPVLDSNAQLHPNQIYFVLPNSTLRQKLTASDMAALAVKASKALQNASSRKDPIRRKQARVSPVFTVDHSPSRLVNDDINMKHSTMIKSIEKPKAQQQQLPLGFSRSTRVRKLQKCTSRRNRSAVRSFEVRLSTIYEGTLL